MSYATDLVEEGLAYFEKSGDAGDKEYVKAIRQHIAHLSAQAKVRVSDDEPMQVATQLFAEYFVKNYPGPKTIICDPNWHAPRIFRAAVSSIERAYAGPVGQDFAARLSQGAQNNVSDNNERMCCSGAECGCQGVTKGQWRAHLLAKQLSHGDAVGDVYWEHADGESEMRVNWFGDPPPIGTMLYTHPAERAAVPDEWVLVPRVPTAAMEDAAFDTFEIDDAKTQGFNSGTDARNAIYKAMLTAAPQPPEGARVVDGLTAQTFGEWCNTLTHAYMYITEREPANAQYGIEKVINELRAWQRKLAGKEGA